VLQEMFSDLYCFVDWYVDIRFRVKDMGLGVTFVSVIVIFSCSSLRRNFVNLYAGENL
jgi:type IV secretory pathway component VirB8